MPLRITTFNCENLFGRYSILDKPPKREITNYENLLKIPEVVTLQPGRSGKIKPAAISKEQRANTAKAILGAQPDLLAVQEVENLTTLRLFNAKYMDSAFDQIILVDGNDARGIDVGFLVRKGLQAQILGMRTHCDESIAGGYLPKTNRLDTKTMSQAIFSRDCLEVDVKIDGAIFTFLVNHFKAQDAKPATTQKRSRQAARVAQLATDARNAGKYPIVLGDLNIDNRQHDYDNSLDPLLGVPVLSDPFANLAAADRWTHFYDSDNKVSRLDYILIDSRLHADAVEIYRAGLSPECKQYTGPRIKGVKKGLEASDHCPTTVVLSS
ncbi:MAG: endonuclease/exonuclease/phosphatase family protein [Bryobacteraceae bacterium]